MKKQLYFCYLPFLGIALILGLFCLSVSADNPAANDKSGTTSYMLNVNGGDAIIHGLTLGRGKGAEISNSAFGIQALFNNTLSEGNTAIGYYSLHKNTTGADNTGIGKFALFFNTNGYQNTAVGESALYNNETGLGNTALGYYSLLNNTTGRNNTAIGSRTLNSNSTGQSNVAIGVRALFRNTVRSNLVAVGDSALHNNGQNAQQTWHGTANTAVGSKALLGNTIGNNNSAFGFNALRGNTTGANNDAFGFHSLFFNTGGSNNTAYGAFSLSANTTGNHNVALGYHSLVNNNTGSYNVALGDFAIGLNADATNSVANVAIGFEAGGFITTGYGNVLIGEQTGKGITTGYDNVWIGKKIGATGTHTVRNTIVIGANTSVPTVNNRTHIGSGSMGWIGGQVTWSTYSDARAKTGVRQDVPGLDFILALRPVSYHWDVDAMNARLGVVDPEKHEGYYDIESARITGFLAQEVAEAARTIGYDFSGVDHTGDVYSLRYAEFVVPLVKAVQEQQAQIELLEGKNLLLEEKNIELERKVDHVLTLLSARGIDLGSGPTNDPSRAGYERSDRNMGASNARLEQNAPNPFQDNTVIRYYLPENTGNAQLIVTDLQGNRIQTNSITGSGPGALTIHGGALSPGTYVYSLIINGQVADSKRMVIL